MPRSSITFLSDGTQFTTDYDWQPEEARTHNYPGCPEEFELTALYFGNGDNTTNWLDEFTESAIEAFTEETQQAIKDSKW